MILLRKASSYMARNNNKVGPLLQVEKQSLLPKFSSLQQQCSCFSRRNCSNTATTNSPIQKIMSNPIIPQQLLQFQQNKSMTKEELTQLYSKWSSTYDQDMMEQFAYVVPQRASEELDHQIRMKMVKSGKGYIDEEQNPLVDGHSHQRIRIADIGVGTGFVGECLSLMSKGNYDLIAIDNNANMLEMARVKNIYQEYHCMDISCEKDMAQAKESISTFGFLDAAMSVESIFEHHHIHDIQAIDHMIQMVRNPGGIICFTTRSGFMERADNGFANHLERLQANGKLKQLNVTEPEPISWGVPDFASFQTWTYMVVS